MKSKTLTIVAAAISQAVVVYAQEVAPEESPAAQPNAVEVTPSAYESKPEGVGEESPFSFNAGGDIRVRQEIMRNVPATPGGGYFGRPGVERGKTKNQIRFRPRVWTELKAGDSWRLYMRLADEFRAGLVQKTHNATFPGEVVLDNLFVEGKGLFDDFLDVRIGRQDLIYMYGLNHIFVDGTPGDGSRTTYADMANIALHFTEDSWLDLFALYNRDQEELRWGTKRSRHSGLTGFGPNEREMDDWGFGAVWNSRFSFVKYQLFAIQKDTASFHDRAGQKHPFRQVNLFGTKIVPEWTENFSTPVELMTQIGRNGDDDTLSAWSAYTGFDWRGGKICSTMKPFWKGGVLIMSGDRNGARTDREGGHHAWDPMWYRGVDDSEMFLYGTNYGVGWWSNQINIKNTLGMKFGPHHSAQVMFGPIFAERKDGLGGGGGSFKGFISQARYDFPIYVASEGESQRFEIFGHLLAEFFNPGDYFESDKPACFFRWQIEVKF